MKYRVCTVGESRFGFWRLIRRLAIAAVVAQVFSPASATITISRPESVYFGNLNPLAVSPANRADRTMVITNTGNEATTLYPFTIDSPSYSILSHTCWSGFDPGQSCSITVRFNPPATDGWVYGMLGINAYGAPYQFGITLQGISYTPPGTLTLTSPTNTTNFGIQPYGTPSTSQTLTLQNTGSTPVTASPPTSSYNDYVVESSTCSGTINPGATCNVTVTMIPSATGPLTSTIAIPNSGMGGAVTVTGAGSGEPGIVFGGNGNSAGLPGGTGTKVDDKNVHGSLPSTSTSEQKVPTITTTGNRLKPWGNSVGWGVVHPFDDAPSRPEDRETENERNVEETTCEEVAAIDDSPLWPAGQQKILLASADSYDLGRNVPATDRIYTADPIHAGLGNKSHPQTDYSARGGYALTFVRTYQAQAPNASALVRQKMGPGWYSNWDKTVKLSPDDLTARVTRGDGSSILFTKQANGTWLPPTSDITDKLTRLFDSNGYPNAWTYKTGSVTENYTAGMWGRLTSVTLASGESYGVTYDTADRLRTVTDPAGRVLTFNYDAKGRLSTLTDPAGTNTTYSYDDGEPLVIDRLGRLMSVTFPDNRARRYKYGLNTRKFALTSIATFENGVENTYVTFSYDETNGRATGNSFGTAAQEEDRSGRATVFFNPDGSSVAYDPSKVVRDTQGNYNLITAGQYPTYATVKRSFTTIQGLVLPTSIEYSHICGACLDASESFNYNTDGRLISHTDRRGVVTTYTYTTDGRSLVASATQAAGTGLMRTVSTTWHATLPVPLQVTEPTRTTNYTYDGAGRTLTASVAAAGQETRTATYTYNAQGWLASARTRTDVNDTTTYTYHTNGNVYQVTNPKGQVTTYYSYDAHGNPTYVLNADGTISGFMYDARGRLTAKTAAGLTTTNTYTTNGQLKTVTDPYGAVTTYVYDDAHRLIRKDQSNGEKIAYTLDNAGRTIVTRTFDAENNLATTSSTVYDGLNRVSQSINAAGKVTSYTYDANGNVTAVTDPNNLTTTTQYDVLNRPILITDPLTKTIATTYTVHDKVATIQDPNNNTTTYTYNGFGDRTAIQSPDTGSTTMIVNQGGLVSGKTDARGKYTSYTYDVLGRLILAYFSDGANVSQTYDVAANGVGRLASVTDSSGSTSYAYDAYGRVISKVSTITGLSGNRTISYSRDAQGRITSITYPSGNVLGMTYAQGRVTNMTLNGGALISGIEYFPLGGPESWLLGANVAGVKDYTRYIDQNSRIEKYSTPTGYRKLSFDNGSRITGIGDYLGTNTSPTATQAFGYDNAGRITSFSGYTGNGNAQANITQTQSFTYDNNGNRLTSVLNSSSSTYSYQAGKNRLSGVIGGITRSNTYDLAGNLTNDGSAVMTYDARGRMVTANASGLSTSYLINYQNLRVKKSNANENRYFVYDDAGHMMGEYDQAGAAIQELFWLGDTPVALKGTMPCLTGTSCAETATAYVWADHLNTPRELTRVNGSNQHVSIWRWDSLPFGETNPNQDPSNLGLMTFNHRFPGQYRDSETGLHQNWHRDFDPATGRYIQPDPLSLLDDVNIYRYAKANPLSIVDPEGLCGCGQAIAAQATKEATSSRGRTRYTHPIQNTCNIAVAMILQNATGTYPRRDGMFIDGPIAAQQWGNPNSSIAGFTTSAGAKEPGDVVSDGYHVGILVGHPDTGEWAVVSQSSNTNQLEINSAGFLNKDGSLRPGVTSWRCGC